MRKDSIEDTINKVRQEQIETEDALKLKEQELEAARALAKKVGKPDDVVAIITVIETVGALG